MDKEKVNKEDIKRAEFNVDINPKELKPMGHPCPYYNDDCPICFKDKKSNKDPESN